jgi:hypothetical protein
MLFGHSIKDLPPWRVAAIRGESQVRATRGKYATVIVVAKLLKAGKHPRGYEGANIRNGSAFPASHD